MKLVFLDTKTMGDIPNLHLLDKFGDVAYYQTTNPDQTLERVKEADIIITNKVVVDRRIIEQAKNLKLICVSATGTNNVDKEAAQERGIPVKNAADYSTYSVAQATFSLLLHLLNKVYYFDGYVKSGGYSQTDIFTHFGRTFWEINGKRFGIIGLGNIGRQVAKIADAFGAEVVYYSASGRNTDQPYLRLELDEFLQTCDIVSIHAPLNEYTANLINYDRLRLMKKSAILLNAGRGGIIHEADLARALNEDLIAAAGIDVYEKEPIALQNPLLQVKNKEKLALTPHFAWASIEARTLLMDIVGRNIQAFLKEEK
ncbi:D-2-hydroxyacid dehydrogenase [Rhodocytophaga aerolata]|uniref:D-2-hydroxyacid dehydrogenase n=1 Tax=Rhodocytophaga aerolata TaxID=455078 RepID=A0ABT8R174_9BACT|nr:D-2-hydroxyacid dehydrogenase [Rhodocytophaga aerolata]MDO1445669.1 D-2-hydroxyacid dehydrogenase [Rhodocytophaga aerolata]